MKREGLISDYATFTVKPDKRMKPVPEPEKKKFPATVRAWSAERAEYTVECEQPPLSAVVWQ